MRLAISVDVNAANEHVIQDYFRKVGYEIISIEPAHHEHGPAEGLGDDWYAWHWAVEIEDQDAEKMFLDSLRGVFSELETKIEDLRDRVWANMKLSRH